MNKIFILLTLFLFACSSNSKLEKKAKHQAETGTRVNEAQKNTDSLFEEMN